MAFFSVISTDTVTVATDRCVVPASEIDALSSATDMASRLSELHEHMDERVREAERKGFEAGFRQGLADGEASAAETLSEHLLKLDGETEREREALRVRAIDNALGIVRRIATTLGDSETLAALALTAAHELMPSPVIVVQVHPDQLDEVRLRLAEQHRTINTKAPTNTDAQDVEASLPGLTLLVEAEESLELVQCRLRAASGTVVLAGLETQLQKIERHTGSANTSNSQIADSSLSEQTLAESPASVGIAPS